MRRTVLMGLAVLSVFCSARYILYRLLSTAGIGVESGPKPTALDSMSQAQVDILDRTSRAVNLDTVINLDAATDLLMRTSESLAGVMGGSANGKAAGAA